MRNYHAFFFLNPSNDRQSKLVQAQGAYDLQPQTLRVPLIDGAFLYFLSFFLNSPITSNLVQDRGENVVQAEGATSIAFRTTLNTH